MWLASVIFLFTNHNLREQLTLIAFVPLIILISLFPNTFTLPSGIKRDKITFTLSDAFVFLTACWYGVLPAVFIAATYPFTKRFFALPQAYLGIAFGFGRNGRHGTIIKLLLLNKQ